MSQSSFTSSSNGFSALAQSSYTTSNLAYGGTYTTTHSSGQFVPDPSQRGSTITAGPIPIQYGPSGTMSGYLYGVPRFR
tara:strand:- start:1985 stop:2221 length:237 start_codon:yes stop_codon:yes gene_type:complete